MIKRGKVHILLFTVDLSHIGIYFHDLNDGNFTNYDCLGVDT